MSNYIFINNPYILKQNTNTYGEYINEGNFYDYIFSININSLVSTSSNGITGLFNNASYRQNQITISYNSSFPDVTDINSTIIS